MGWGTQDTCEAQDIVMLVAGHTEHSLSNKYHIGIYCLCQQEIKLQSRAKHCIALYFVSHCIALYLLSHCIALNFVSHCILYHFVLHCILLLYHIVLHVESLSELTWGFVKSNINHHLTNLGPGRRSELQAGTDREGVERKNLMFRDKTYFCHILYPTVWKE